MAVQELPRHSIACKMGSQILSPYATQLWKENVKNGFRKDHLKEADDQAIVLQNCAENPFLELYIENL